MRRERGVVQGTAGPRRSLEVDETQDGEGLEQADHWRMETGGQCISGGQEWVWAAWAEDGGSDLAAQSNGGAF